MTGIFPKKTFACALAFFLCLPLAAEEAARIPDSGHIGSVLALAWDKSSGELFSAGEDGALRVWNTSPFRLERKFQAAELPIRKIALNPKASEIALVQSDGISSHSLKVLNRETGKLKFSQSLQEVPLFLGYSPKGTYITVTKADWKSLTILSAQTGRTVSYMRNGFGIVSFLMFSESENTLLTYTPSAGNFTYWELRTAKQKELVRSAVGLENITVYNQRFALASRGDELVAVDMVSGFITASVKVPGITKIAAAADGRIMTMSSSGGTSTLSKWMFIAPVGASPGILSHSGEAINLPPDTADAVFSADSSYFALAGGAIGCMFGGSSQMEHEGTNPINPVTDILAAEGVLYALTAEKIYSFQSDIFMQGENEAPASPGGRPKPAEAVKAPSFFTASAGNNPLAAPAGIIKDAGGNIFFYTLGGKAGRLARVDIENKKILSQYAEFSRPLVSVEESGGFLFALEKNGSLKKIDSASMKTVYEYPAWNVQCIAAVDEKIFWAGQAKSEQHDSPLIMINTETGETVPVRTKIPLLLVPHIIHDKPRGKIYFLGLTQGSGGKTETRIFSANNPQKPESSPSIGTYAAADINAAIHIDSGQFAVYTTLGNTVIQKWTGSRWSSFESNGTMVKTLRDYGQLLFGINADGSVSAWDKRGGKLAGTFCILKDGSWIAVAADGQALTSSP